MAVYLLRRYQIICFTVLLTTTCYITLAAATGISTCEESTPHEAHALRDQWLDGENVNIILQRETNTSFFFVDDNPNEGIDPIRSFLQRAEGSIRDLYHHLLYTPDCKTRDTANKDWGAICHSDQKGQLVLDVGANRGYYTLLSASHGHEVIAFEPQPHCFVLLKSCLLLNGYQCNVKVKQNFVSVDSKSTLKIKRRTGCTGTYPNDNDDGWAESFRKPLQKLKGADDEISVTSVRLDQVVPHGRVVSLLKIDVEGFEWNVIESGKTLFQQNRIKNLLVEFNIPMLKKQNDNWNVMKIKTMSHIKWLYSLGYKGKVSVRGHWKHQKPMTIEEWKQLFDDAGFITADAWFFK